MNKTGPVLVAWESTKACRFVCRHCRAEAQFNPDSNQLTTPEVKRFIDDIASMAKPTLIITGGDPLLRSDIYEVSRYADGKGLRVVMALNGNIDSKTASTLASSGVRMVSLSIDGSTPKIHDEFRGVEGAFDMALRSTESIRAQRLPFRILTTVTKHNLRDLGKIYSLVDDLGAESWDIFMLVPTGRASHDMEISPAEYEDVLKFIHDLSLRSEIPVKVTCAPHYNRLLLQSVGGAAQTRISRGCMAGNGFCFVSHVGDVYGCGYLPIPAGNIREKSFIEIYSSSPLFDQLRDRRLLKGKCQLCSFREVCGGCRARAYSTYGDAFAEEPYCTYRPEDQRATA
ncbi:MAG: radical SAM protein [Candidatus Bathyarchaeia archaeon]